MIKSALEKIKTTAISELSSVADLKALDDLRVKFLGKKGELTAILKQMGSISAEERPIVGQLANQIRAEIEEQIEQRGATLHDEMIAQKLEDENWW